MTRLTFPAYLDHIHEECRRFREVLTDCDPAARVPGCPDWDAADLLWHLAEGHNFWAWVIANRPADPEGPYVARTRPDSYADLLALFDECSAALVEDLGKAGPAEEAWTWAPEHTVGFTYRRQAHESLIHRIDAEQAAGVESGVDTALAADGVEETLAVMYGGCPPWGAFTPGEGVLRFDLTDAGESVWVRLGRFTGTDPDGESHDEADLNVVDDPGEEPDVVVAGGAGPMDLWLWHRGDEAALSVTGDRGVYDRFATLVTSDIS